MASLPRFLAEGVTLALKTNTPQTLPTTSAHLAPLVQAHGAMGVRLRAIRALMANLPLAVPVTIALLTNSLRTQLITSAHLALLVHFPFGLQGLPVTRAPTVLPPLCLPNLALAQDVTAALATNTLQAQPTTSAHLALLAPAPMARWVQHLVALHREAASASVLPGHLFRAWVATRAPMAQLPRFLVSGAFPAPPTNSLQTQPIASAQLALLEPPPVARWERLPASRAPMVLPPP